MKTSKLTPEKKLELYTKLVATMPEVKLKGDTIPNRSKYQQNNKTFHVQ